MDGMEIRLRRLDISNRAAGSTQRTGLDPMSPTTMKRIGFECST